MTRLPSPIYLQPTQAPMPFGEEGENGTATSYAKSGAKRRIAFGWYGGKFNHLNWLLPLLPQCHHYCEPFGGSAAVLINREPTPVETYNDMDGEVVNFFKVLRDRTDGGKWWAFLG